ncbi:uncharacterized protein TRAVEDRAFT_170515 [Trametes versicolor FP-101664 SS1]|uniref:uncharacterized protein n=1 Tax=Trametes versicolor (strain FP-101664) TaxID=717944 RepID=UPI000462151A|nr:uncharacterized protein TRAVEDRAFT_170515 [Trametes versicolor FP-101664 SS1]EIW56613.1 hypothetical protein TRAVEDRAFT_170515 [Trametes versicolor FP-101664 SS1]
MAQVQAQAEPWVPTVNDLRVKLCYICREEERYDNPESPARPWTHPCACTLVAHEACLLQWIKSAQQDPARARNALKCPQCGAAYALESANPPLLRALDAANALLAAAGKAATVVGVACAVVSVGATVYMVSTSYGAFAVKEFLGEEMFNLLLTDDPSKWPWHAFIHLPVIPFSLILSRTRLFDTFPLVPLLLTWATSPPVLSASSSASSSASTSSTTPIFAPSLASLLGLHRPTDPRFVPALNWPPTPLMALVLFPALRIAYRRAFARLTRAVMGTHAGAETGPAARIRRVVLAMNEDGPAPIRLRIGAEMDRPVPAAGNAPAANPNAANANAAAGANLPALGDEPADDPAGDAERTLHVTTSSLGRFVGGALLMPSIAARMGALLLRLSAHSSLLRTLLAIHPRAQVAAPPARIRLFAPGHAPEVGVWRQVGGGLLTGFNILCGGTPTWNAHDPVWWRNAVGLGIFVFTKDCIELLHLYLKKRELESRRVKSRDFAGVDIKELDLIRPVTDAPAPAVPETEAVPQPAAADAPPPLEA